MDMKDFAWNVFCSSGNVEAFLLYKKDDEIIHRKNDKAENMKKYENVKC